MIQEANATSGELPPSDAPLAALAARVRGCARDYEHIASELASIDAQQDALARAKEGLERVREEADLIAMNMRMIDARMHKLADWRGRLEIRHRRFVEMGRHGEALVSRRTDALSRARASVHSRIGSLVGHIHAAENEADRIERARRQRARREERQRQRQGRRRRDGPRGTTGGSRQNRGQQRRRGLREGPAGSCRPPAAAAVGAAPADRKTTPSLPLCRPLREPPQQQQQQQQRQHRQAH